MSCKTPTNIGQLTHMLTFFCTSELCIYYYIYECIQNLKVPIVLPFLFITNFGKSITFDIIIVQRLVDQLLESYAHMPRQFTAPSYVI